MKLTKHNGRAGKNGVYNPKHNDRSFNANEAEHIDAERMKQNIYWDWIRGYSSWEDHNPNEDLLDLRFESVEKNFYFKQYDDFCEAQHERNRITGHSKRNRSTEDLRLNKKTCPEESLIQIGCMEEHIDADVLLDIAKEYFEQYEQRFGKHVHILDWGLHVDESTPHIHERHVFDCENEYGEIAPQQEKALEALNIPLPYPDKPNSKNNNRKIMFDSICRTMLLDIAKAHGIELDEVPEYGGREYLEKQDYIIYKQKQKIQENEIAIEQKETQLNELLLKTEDLESLIDTVTEVAYDKAVEVVKDAVIAETHNADFEIIKSFQKYQLSKESKLSDKAKAFTKQLLDALMKKFKGMTETIAAKLDKMFASPAIKTQHLQPIREATKKSVMEDLKKKERIVKSYEPTAGYKHNIAEL